MPHTHVLYLGDLAPLLLLMLLLLLLLLLLLSDDGLLDDGPVFNDIGLAQHVNDIRAFDRHHLLLLLSRTAVRSRFPYVLFRFLVWIGGGRGRREGMRWRKMINVRI